MAKDSTPAEHIAFMAAVRQNNLDAARDALASGIKAEILVDGLTPLFEAARHGYADMANLLLQAGANPNRRMKGGGHAASATALNIATSGGRLPVVEILLDADANPRSLNSDKQTAAHILIEISGVPGGKFTANNERLKISSEEWPGQVHSLLTRMLDRGVEVNQQDEKGTTLLHYAVLEKVPAVLVETLLARGANPYVTDRYGFSPVNYACTSGLLDHLDALKRSGVDISRPTLRGDSYLHLCDKEAIFRYLMSMGPCPDLEAVDQEGRTPLADALLRWDESFWKGKAVALIAAGARLDAVDFEGVTPEMIIKRKKLTEVATFVAAQNARNAMSDAADGLRARTR